MNSTADSTPEKQPVDQAAAQLDADRFNDAQLNAEYRGQLERIAWAIVQDWELAADAVQEAFVVLAQKRESVPAPRRLAWLIRTVQFQAQNLRRRKNKELRFLSADDNIHQIRETLSQGETADQAEQIELLRIAIEQLPETQRVVVVKRLNEERSFADIAHELEIPLGTVLSRMRLALAKLRLALDEESHE